MTRVYCAPSLHPTRRERIARWIRRNDRAFSMTAAAVMFAAWLALIIFGAEILRAVVN